VFSPPLAARGVVRAVADEDNEGDSDDDDDESMQQSGADKGTGVRTNALTSSTVAASL